MKNYYDNQGNTITLNQIKKSVKAGDCTLINSWGEGCTNTSVSLIKQDFDTTGACYSVWDESWTRPATLEQAILAAQGE